MESPKTTELLAELIQKKHQILSEILDLVIRQTDMVDQNELKKLMSLLAHKQALLNELQVVDQHLAPFRDEDPDQRHWKSQQDRQQCRQTADECTSVLQQIMELEKKSEQTLETRRDQTESQLQNAYQGTQATSQYLTPGSAEPRRLDITSD